MYLNIDGVFQPGTDLAGDAVARTTSVAIGDLDGDTQPDVVVGNDNAASLVITGNLVIIPTPVTADDVPVTSIALGDVNNDGDLDIVFGVDGDSDLLFPQQRHGQPV